MNSWRFSILINYWCLGVDALMLCGTVLCIIDIRRYCCPSYCVLFKLLIFIFHWNQTSCMYNTVKSVLAGHCLERPPVLNDRFLWHGSFLIKSSLSWTTTCCTRPVTQTFFTRSLRSPINSDRNMFTRRFRVSSMYLTGRFILLVCQSARG